MQLVNNRIQGLDLLIHGLSGKFLSSVVAVACATLLVSAEKGLFHPVKACVASLWYDPEKTPAETDLCSDTP